MYHRFKSRYNLKVILKYTITIVLLTTIVYYTHQLYQWRQANPNNILIDTIETFIVCSAAYGVTQPHQFALTSTTQHYTSSWQPSHHTYMYNVDYNVHHYLSFKSTYTGMGDQLQQYLHAVVLADKHNLTFLSSVLPGNRKICWDNYFNLHRNEKFLIDLPLSHIDNLMHHHYNIDYNYHGMVYAERRLVQLIQHCNQQQIQCLFTLGHVQLPPQSEHVVCQPHIIQQFRQKYCLQRIESSHNTIQQFTRYTVPNSIPVVIHYRAGDIAASDNCNKRVAFHSVAQTIRLVYDILHDTYNYNVTFHIMSERPWSEEFNHAIVQQWIQNEDIDRVDITQNNYFDVLTKHPLLTERNIYTVLHLDTDAEDTFYAMITAPIFISSGSGYSTMANLLRSGLTLAIRPSCSPYVTMLNSDGTFDTQQFVQQLDTYMQTNDITQWQPYNNIEQCLNIEQWPQLTTYEPNMTYYEQGILDPCPTINNILDDAAEQWKREQQMHQ